MYERLYVNEKKNWKSKLKMKEVTWDEDKPNNRINAQGKMNKYFLTVMLCQKSEWEREKNCCTIVVPLLQAYVD